MAEKELTRNVIAFGILRELIASRDVSDDIFKKSFRMADLFLEAARLAQEESDAAELEKQRARAASHPPRLPRRAQDEESIGER